MGWLVGLPLGIFRLLGGLLLVILRVGWPFLLGGLLYWLRRRSRRSAGQAGRTAAREPDFDGPVYTVEYEEVPKPVLSAVPDAPVPFGYKTSYLAVASVDPWQVMEAMDLLEPVPANWTTGLAAACAGQGVFVSPCLDGFVLVVGGPEPCPGFLEALGGAFSQVQFFATHRVTEYHHWGKYAGGTLVRDYCYCGESGAVLQDEGPLTAEETALGFDRFPRKGREEESEDFPGEEDVLDIAAAWGVDPRFEKKTWPLSTGWLCAL